MFSFPLPPGTLAEIGILIGIFSSPEIDEGTSIMGGFGGLLSKKKKKKRRKSFFHAS